MNILQFYETTSIIPLKTWRKEGIKVGEGKILNYVTEAAPLVRRRKAPWPHAQKRKKSNMLCSHFARFSIICVCILDGKTLNQDTKSHNHQYGQFVADVMKLV